RRRGDVDRDRGRIAGEVERVAAAALYGLDAFEARAARLARARAGEAPHRAPLGTPQAIGAFAADDAAAQTAGCHHQEKVARLAADQAFDAGEGNVVQRAGSRAGYRPGIRLVGTADRVLAEPAADAAGERACGTDEEVVAGAAAGTLTGGISGGLGEDAVSGAD